MLKLGLWQTDITPEAGVSIAGYFNDRIAEGVLDRLYARVIILEKNITLVIITLDLIGLASEDTEKIRKRLAAKFAIPRNHIMISCTHTHTGPAPFSIFEVKKEKKYIEDLMPKIEEAFIKARNNLADTEIYITRSREKDVSFNRRYIMRDGSVITNPPRESQDVLRPEGPVDNLLTSLVFASDGKIRGILVNATNHVDCIGGNRISADWPGHLEQELNRKLKAVFPVLVLTGAAGNINHLNRNIKGNQCSYKDSKGIAKAYSRYILGALKEKKPLEIDKLACLSKNLTVPYRKLNPDDIKEAKRLIKIPFSKPAGDLTSEDLAQGNIAVKKLFAKELLSFLKLRRKIKKGKVNITVFKIGPLALIGIPGEPFVEIGLAVKKMKYFPYTIVTGNTNGSAGYIPLKKHFKKGGYEISTNLYNRFSEELGERIIKSAVQMVKSICRKHERRQVW